MTSKGSGDPRFAYPMTAHGVRMPPMTSAFDRQLSALPLSVEPPYDDPYEPHPLDQSETRNLVRVTWPRVGTMTDRGDGRMARSILRGAAQGGAVVSELLAQQGQVGEGGLLRGDLAAERVVQTRAPTPVDWTRQSPAARRADRRWERVEAVPYPDDDTFDPDDNLPIIFDLAEQEIAQVQAVADAQETERQLQQQDLRRFAQAAGEAEQVARAALQDQNSQISSVAVSSLLAKPKGSPAVHTEPSSKPVMQPIFEPLHNAREIAKQLVLLEDHLAHPSRRCHDCIRKHLLTAEGLADEAVTLDEVGEHRDRFRAAAQELRDIAKVFTAGGDRDRLQSRVRELRKQMSKDGFGAMEERTPEHINAEHAHAHGQAPAGSASTSTPPSAPGRTLAPGAMVAYRAGGQWYPGRVGVVGPGVVSIRSVSPSAYGPRPTLGDTVTLKGTPEQLASLIVPLNNRPISAELSGKRITGYKTDGTVIPGTPALLRPEQLFFADLIQGVFDRVLATACEDVGVGSAAAGGRGCHLGVHRQLARLGMITAWYESRLDPRVSNTSGADDSWGLFQLNRKGGIGQGYMPATLLDPVENATIIAGVIKKRIGDFAILIKREAALQPTKTGEWITIFTNKIQRPQHPSLSAQARAKTADQVFPSSPGNALASAGVAPAAEAPASPVATPAAAAQVVPSFDSTASLMSQGNAMNAQIFAQRYPQEGRRLEPIDAPVQALLEIRSSPIDMDSFQAAQIRKAARAWLAAGRSTGSPPAAMRAAYLYRLSGEMRGYVEALRVVQIQTAGTTLATEAETLIAQALAANPEAAPPADPAKGVSTGYTTTQKVILGGGVALLTLAATAALRSWTSADEISRKYR